MVSILTSFPFCTSNVLRGERQITTILLFCNRNENSLFGQYCATVTIQLNKLADKSLEKQYIQDIFAESSLRDRHLGWMDASAPK